MKMMKYLIVMILITTIGNYPQTVYNLPFGSRGNIIELSITNETGVELERVKVEVKNKPEWIKIEELRNEIEQIRSGEEGIAIIKFSVDKKAELEKEESIKIEILNNEKVIEEKEIRFIVSPPKEYILEQNYPNPFNPKTKIGYQIPEECEVKIRIYDILGREIEVIERGNKKPGYYEVEYNGGKLTSGMYIYSLEGKGIRINKKMMVIK